jgi:hypothetical protein
MTPLPDNQVAQHLSDASRVLKARGSPRTPRALNLRRISDVVQNDGDIPSSARELIRDLIDFVLISSEEEEEDSVDELAWLIM